MFDAIDDALEAMVRRDALDGTRAGVEFDAPTRAWADGRKGSAVDLYLYDVTEDLRRREIGHIDVRDAEGRITGRRAVPRSFTLSYLVTAWAPNAADEHKLLARVLACFLRTDRLPADLLTGALADTEVPVTYTVAAPPAADRSMADLWTALGGELRPSLDLIVRAPFDLDRLTSTAQIVLEEPKFRFGGPDGEEAQRRSKGDGDDDEDAAVPDGAEETVLAGADPKSGRRFDLRELPRRES